MQNYKLTGLTNLYMYPNNKSSSTLLQSDQTDLGHLVAPDGVRHPNRPIDIDSDMMKVKSKPLSWVSLGVRVGRISVNSITYLTLQSEITGFKPWCIHLSWFNKYRELLCKRTEARNASPSGTPDKCVAWWYAPPANHISDGRFVLLYTNSGAQSPLSHWRTYKPKEVFTQHACMGSVLQYDGSRLCPIPWYCTATT
jgi:hypothetical protein